MSATDELRRLLDERGVKWWPMRNNGYYEDRDTEFVANGKKHTAHEWGDGFAVYSLTPEQAIAATLGRGTCRNEWGQFGKFRCSNCWLQVDSISTNTTQPIDIEFCPKCGKAVRNKR